MTSGTAMARTITSIMTPTLGIGSLIKGTALPSALQGYLWSKTRTMSSDAIRKQP
jgi:hypothetical protein